MTLSPEAIALITVSASASLGIMAYGINRLFKKNKNSESQTPKTTSMTIKNLENAKKILKRRTELTGAVDALNLLDEALRNRHLNRDQQIELLGTIAEANLTTLDKMIDEKYPPKDKTS